MKKELTLVEKVEEYLRMEATKERAARNKKLTIPYLFHLLILLDWCVLINFLCFMIAIFLVK